MLQCLNPLGSILSHNSATGTVADFPFTASTKEGIPGPVDPARYMYLRRPNQLLVKLAVFLVICIGGFLAYDVRYEYERELSTLKQHLPAEARLSAEHAELSLATAHRALRELEETVRQKGIEQLEGDREYWQRARRTLARIPQLAQMAIMDAQGNVRFTSSTFPTPTVNVTDREYFRAHAQGQRLHINSTVSARDNGRMVLPVTRRINGPEGEFQGVLFASLDMDYFQALHSSLRNGRDLRIGMFRKDGAILSLYPAPPMGIGKTLEAQSTAGAFTSVSSFAPAITTSAEGVRELVAYRALNTFPVVVRVSYNYDAFLSKTVYPMALRNLALFLIFALGTVVAVTVIRRAIAQAVLARGAQRASERLSRAIISHLPNGRVAVFDRDRRYTFADGQGFSDHPRLNAQNIVGKTMAEIYTADGYEIIKRLADQAFAGEEAEEEIAYEDCFYKVMVVPLDDGDGAIDRCMLLTQDITELKQTQQALETLSATDGLLDIANRREFERVLKLEWRRSTREQQPLALLMIDVDSFKLYNDSYGHQQGDVCLKEVARVLEEAVARPGDVVARYGGEEIAVLLPRTDLEGALHVAERIHDLLEQNNIPFPDSTVADRITVSIGAASTTIFKGREPNELVADADSQVYAAKDAGRNTTRPSAATP